MKLADFFVQLGVEADTVTVRDFVGAITEIPLAVTGAIAALAGISFEIKSMITESLEASVAFQKFQAATGLSFHELDRWQRAAERVNVSADAVRSSLVGIAKAVAMMALGQNPEAAAAFGALGIDSKQSPFKILEALARASKNSRWTREQFEGFASQMGVNAEDLMPLLLQSEAERTKAMNAVSGMTDEQQKSFLKAKESLVELGQAFHQLGLDVTDALTPMDRLVGVLTALVSKTDEIVKGHKPNAGMLSRLYSPDWADVPSWFMTSPLPFTGLGRANGAAATTIFNVTVGGVNNLKQFIQDLLDERDRSVMGHADGQHKAVGY